MPIPPAAQLCALAVWLAIAPVAAAVPEPDDAGAAGLGWLAGRWSGTNDGTLSEEQWTSAEGGALLGMHKDIRSGRMVSFEFFRIAADADGKICYFASPGGRPPTPFCLVEQGERRVVFENRAHDFPQRILYWIGDEGALHARIEGPMAGRTVTEEWIWKRASD